MYNQPKELLQTLEAFIHAETWDKSRRILDAHPEILSEHADAALSQLASQQTTEESRIRTERCRSLLQRCREVGPDRAFVELTGAVDVPPEYNNDIRAAQAAEAQYQCTSAPDALEEAITAWERILQHPNFPASPERFQLATLNNAGNTFLARYSARGVLDDLEQALALWRTALPLIPRRGSPDRSRSLVSLTSGLHTRYEHLGDPADLEQAIELCRDAVQEARPYSLELPASLVNLGKFLLERHARCGHTEDLEESIHVLEMAHAQCAPRSPYWSATLTNLGSALMARYFDAGDPQDLERAIEIFRSAVESTPADEGGLASQLSNLGSALNERYNAFGDPTDLDSAIGFLQKAVEGTPPASPDLPAHLTGLGLTLGARYDREGRPEDLESAIQAFSQAVDSTPPGSPDLVGYQNNLGGQLRVRYEHTGASKDLEEAIQCFREAIRLAPAGSPDLPGSYTNLGTGLMSLYAVTGQLKVLEETIDAFRRASQSIPPGSPNLPVYLNDLGAGLSMRYDRIGLLEDLDECLELFERAVSSTDARSPDLPIYLNNLGMGLLSRYIHTENVEHLNGAIDAFQRAVDGTPRESPERTTYLNNLAVALHDRYQITHQSKDLRTAIRLCRQVVRLTPVDAPDLSPRLNNLGNVLQERYSQKGKLVDLEEAIRIYRQAVQHSAAGSPELPKHLNNLGVVLRDRYFQTEEASDLEEAVSAFEQSCSRGLEVGLEEVLRTACNWGDWASERSAWQEAAHAYRYGLKATDDLFRAQLFRPAKEAWLRLAQQYPARLAYSLARAGDGPAAIVALEASRTRLLGEALEQNRRDLEQLSGLGHSDLYDRYREAAERFQALQAGFEPRGQVAGPALGRPLLSIGADRQAPETVRAQLDAAIDAIRTVPGYNDFYRTPSFEKIQHAVPSQSVMVYLVAAPFGGLALSLPGSDRTSDHRQSDFVELVWLDTLTDAVTAEILVDYLNPYFRWQNEQSEPATKAWYAALEATSKSLGEALAPLVQQIAVWRSSTTASEPHDESTLSIILVPTGLLGLLPLHSVSWKTNGERRFLLDEVILAYAPSAQALASAWLRVGEQARRGDRLLALVNPTGDLPFACSEGEALRVCFGADQAQVLENGAATQEALMASLLGGNYLHFACHGSYNPLDVLRSGLALAGKDPLELWEILGTGFDLRATRLVTLSACETGMIEVQKVPEETLGLPAGFLQAGAPAVVSSLWAVNDFSTSLLMGKFYRRHLAEGQGIAAALRGAQLWLRDTTARDLALADYWAQIYKASGQRDAKSFQAMRYYQAHPDAIPFAHPYHWAAFTASGAV